MRVPLTQGAYTARSVIAEAQRSVNLYAEKNPSDALAPMTHYLCPGLRTLATPAAAPGRGLYLANSGQLFYVAGASVYTVSRAWELAKIGQIDLGSTPVSMADNGTSMVIVDGTANGYEVDLTTLAFSPISEANNAPPAGSVYAFYGADRVDMLDGFMLFNQPGTRNFYSTYNNEIVFDALYFAAKNGYSDNLASIIVTNREIWLPGVKTAEIWFDAGTTDFPFQIMPGPFVQHGIWAKYSLAQVDSAIFWLSQDQAGNNIVARAKGYTAGRISTHALEAAMASYSTTADAIGFCYQQEGHTFYMLTFPTADVTWCWDDASGLWHERAWTDSDGVSHRHRASCATFAYGVNVAADWQTGQLYALDLDSHTDAGAPIQFRRGWPHLMDDGKRVRYSRFVLDIEAATSPDTTDGSGPFLMQSQGVPPFVLAGPDTDPDQPLIIGPVTPPNQPLVNLRWSDTRGRTWSNPVAQSIGSTGQYAAQAQWRRLGMARDRVFEVFGTAPGKIAINGAFVDAESCGS